MPNHGASATFPPHYLFCKWLNYIDIFLGSPGSPQVPHLGKNISMYAFPSCSPHLLHPLCIVVCKNVYPCVASCEWSQSLLFWSHTFECVHLSVHIYMFTWLPTLVPPPSHSCMQKCEPMWPHLSVPITSLLVPHLGYNVNIHEYICACVHDSKPHLNPLT